jgi:hypothetical protein
VAQWTPSLQRKLQLTQSDGLLSRVFVLDEDDDDDETSANSSSFDAACWKSAGLTIRYRS